MSAHLYTRAAVAAGSKEQSEDVRLNALNVLFLLTRAHPKHIITLPRSVARHALAGMLTAIDQLLVVAARLR